MYGKDIFGTLYTHDQWWCVVDSEVIILGNPATSGEAVITLTPNGADMDVDISCPVGSHSDTIAGAATGEWNLVEQSISTYSWDSYTAAYVDYTDVDNGATNRWEWSTDGELDDWTWSNVQVSGGHLLGPSLGGDGYIQTPFLPATPGRALTSVLSAPGIQRIAAVSSANGLQDRYASGALADILTGSLADNHPELVHVGAGGHHLGLVWQRTNDICITTGTGVPGIAGWPNTVQTVAIARSKPTACVIDPTHDLGVAYLNGTEALFSPAAWANGSYVMGTETLIASDAADERGQLLQSPDGYLLYVYRDSGGAVAIKRSANRGQTWS